jgi:hypothetical protein
MGNYFERLHARHAVRTPCATVSHRASLFSARLFLLVVELALDFYPC